MGDGALGFWATVRDVWPQTHEQRCWCHKMVNILDRRPKPLQPKAKRLLREIMKTETKKLAEESVTTFIEEFSLKPERTETCLTKDQEAFLTLYDFPAKHWIHLQIPT